MKCSKLVVMLAFLATAVGMPQNATPSSRAASPMIGDTIKVVSNQLMDLNATSQMILDTRTPPKMQQQKRDRTTTEKIENSHPGIAEPVEDADLILEEVTKKLNFYKGDKPTTDSGLSTWILLSGQTSTSKPMKKRVNGKNATNTFAIEDTNNVIKPLFKRRSTIATTKKPVVASITEKIETSTIAIEKTTKLTKVKASLVTGANKTSTQLVPKKTTTPKTTTVILEHSTTVKPKTTTESTTKKPTTEFVKIATKSNNVVNNETIILSPEAKDGGIEITTNSTKKTKRPTIKRKKNKNRRKNRPAIEDKLDSNNNTKLSTKTKEKPIGTQIYNYLSREVMPTVGVGLVGLMVTAGLASYFLYPFGHLRRSYNTIDRKDKVAPYHYSDEYSGGITEEEAIGKVIAGMPITSYINSNSNNNRAQNSRNVYSNRYRNVDQRYMQGSVETVHLNPSSGYGNEEVIIGSPKQNYNHKESYQSDDSEQKFVVGNIPKEYQDEIATPAAVPEHGPRNIEKPQDEEVFVVRSVPAENPNVLTVNVEHGPRSLKVRRRRRQINNVLENEVDSEFKTSSTTTTSTTVSPSITEAATESLDDLGFSTEETTTTTTKHPLIEKTETILQLIRDLFYLKVRLGLQILQNKTESLSRYFKTVQARIDDSYNEFYHSRS